MKPTGEALLSLAETRLGERYAHVLVPKNDPHWHGAWDCAELASWAVYQVAGILYGCQSARMDPALADAWTSWWDRDARAQGKIVSTSAAASIPGAMHLRLSAKGGHIAISDGKGGTVEAYSSTRGVIRHVVKDRRWSYGIMVPGIDYKVSPEPILVMPTIVFRLTSPMMHSPEVKAIQEALLEQEYSPGAPDGIYGPKTYNAVAKFQGDQGLLIDGEVGPQTMKALGLI